MEVWNTVVYVGAGIILIGFLAWVASRLRGQRRRPGRQDPLKAAQERYEAGEIGERELEQIKNRILKR